MSSLQPDLRMPPAAPRMPPAARTVVLAGVGAAVLGALLAGLGMPALYTVLGALALLVVGRLLRGQVLTPLYAAWSALPIHRSTTAQPRAGLAQPIHRSTTAQPRAGLPRPPATRRAIALTAAGSATVAVLAGLAGVRGIAVVLAVLLLVVTAPRLMTWARPWVRPGLGSWRGAPLGVGVDLGMGDGHGKAAQHRRGWLVLPVGAAVAALGWVAAGLGGKGLLVVVGALAIGTVLWAVRDRHTVLVFLAAATVAVMMHKSFTDPDLQQSGGAVSIYVTTLDVVVVLLYLLWWRSGTLARDLAAAPRRGVLAAVAGGALLALPSLLGAPSLGHAAAELCRMAWMFLLFAYLALRISARRHVYAVLGGLGAVAVLELVVVVLQWRTGGVLGLSFLGVPTELGDRVTDTTVLGRPFGTVLHPVFLGAVLGALATVATALLVGLRNPLLRLAAAVVVASCFGAVWLAQARAAFVAAGLACAVVVAVGVRRRQVAPAALLRIGLAGLVVALPFAAQIIDKISANFGTGHFFTEIDSRLELNDTAERMFADHPFLGVGLNNYELVQGAYDQAPVIFFGHPVHNIYLLVLAETGIVGLAGFALVGLAVARVALRLTRSPDRLLAAVGTGVLAAVAFFAVEEVLGFSLRQDAPLAVFWMLAGLAVAGERLGPPIPARVPRLARVGRSSGGAPRSAGPSHRTTRRLVAAVAVVAVVVLALPPGPTMAGTLTTLPYAVPASSAPSASPSSPLPSRVLLSGVERSTGAHHIYLADTDGSMHRLTPADGRAYSWPRWAFGNTQIVYTVRAGAAGGPEQIAMMRPDGTGVRVLASFDFRVGQPFVDRSGTSLVFTGTAPWFPHVALFRLDLATGLSTNLTAATVSVGGFDSDPSPTPDGRLVFAYTANSTSTQIAEMAADGTGRRVLIDDDTFNTDPTVSADGRLVATASYRGSGKPSTGSATDFSDVKPSGWYIAVRPRSGGAETLLTDGANCVSRPAADPCEVSEMSGVLPRFAPDGAVSFNGALDSQTTCLCSRRPDGSDPKVLIAETEIALDWHDWPQAAGASRSTDAIGSRPVPGRVLLVLAGTDGSRTLVSASPDLMQRRTLALPTGLTPRTARWAADGESVLLTADVDTGGARDPHPAAPTGTTRRAHVTLEDLSPMGLAQRQQRVAALPSDTAAEQVFLRAPDGSVRQLTDPWIEDWQDGLAPGDARGNTSPVPTPDGQAVLVRNVSTLTGESFILRIDLRTGEVRNLTNGTAGVLPTDDADPALSPDGRRVAFAWTEGDRRGIYVMDATTGQAVTPTAAPAAAGEPTWSPDGIHLAVVVTGSDGRGRLQRVAGSGGGSAVPLSGVAPALAPDYSPDGSQVVFLGPSGAVIGLYAVRADGGASARSAPVQPDPLHSVLSVDWR